MNAEDFANIIRLVRRAPLQDMREAEAVGELLQKFSDHIHNYLELDIVPLDIDSGGDS